VDATKEQALALQFDISYYPLIVQFRDKDEVYEWNRRESSLVQFASKEKAVGGKLLSRNFGPFSFVGMW
jgi:hypothetical protein